MFFIRTIPGEPPCPRCRTGFDAVASTGRVGCGECYRHFTARLTPYLSRMYGTAVHKGDIPGSAAPALRRENRIRSLSEALQAAIAAQDFERCAALRDEINALKQEIATPESQGSADSGKEGRP